MKWIFALLVATVASVASAQYSNGWSSYNDPLTGPVNFRTVFQGNDSCIETMGTWVIADQGAWDSFWARHQGNQNQGRWGNGRGGYVGGAPNFCDFTREQLIIVTLGAQQAGTTVLIDRIDRPDSWHYDVYFSTRQLVIGGRPNAGSTPFIIVKTARLGGTPRFIPVQSHWQNRYGAQNGCTHVCRPCGSRSCGGGCGCGFGGPIVYGPSGAIISGACKG